MNERLVSSIKNVMQRCVESNAKDTRLFNEMKKNGASRKELIALRDEMQLTVNEYNEAKKDYDSLMDYATKEKLIKKLGGNEKSRKVNELNEMNLMKSELEEVLCKKYGVSNPNVKDNGFEDISQDNKKKINPITWVCVALAIIAAATTLKSCSKDNKKPLSDTEQVTEDEYLRTSPSPVVTTTPDVKQSKLITNTVFPDTEEGREAAKLYESVMLEKCPKISEHEFNSVSNKDELDDRCEEIYKDLQKLDTKDKQVKNISEEDLQRIMSYIHNGNVEDIKAADKDDVMLDLLSIFDAEIYDSVRVANGNIKASDARKPVLNSMLLAKDGSELQENLYKLHLLRQYLVQNPSKERANVYSLALMALSIDTWYVGDPTNAYTIDALDTSGEKFLYQTAILESFAVAGRNPEETKMQFIKMHEGKEELCTISLKDLTKELNCNDYVIEGDLANSNNTKEGKKVTETKYWGYKMLHEAVLNQQLGLVRK